MMTLRSVDEGCWLRTTSITTVYTLAVGRPHWRKPLICCLLRNSLESSSDFDVAKAVGEVICEGFYRSKTEEHKDTMMEFASFETLVEMLYKHVVPTPKDQCSKSLHLGVSFAGGGVDAETSEEDDIGRSSSSLRKLFS
ncbi:unnamed protein product [Rhodiola kirilowii]